ncbi:hypothetical protein IHE45_06G029900 [Dioscorea alata]|uniref:Uncharacterized protein n=1 Tax=Dioscorea alata TaxID=55571 RepID=A0ACB7VW96_DIOAL|nr:hypothetical protein IHE45_06G029900 [Dioscorea alata]
MAIVIAAIGIPAVAVVVLLSATCFCLRKRWVDKRIAKEINGELSKYSALYLILFGTQELFFKKSYISQVAINQRTNRWPQKSHQKYSRVIANNFFSLQTDILMFKMIFFFKPRFVSIQTPFCCARWN